MGFLGRILSGIFPNIRRQLGKVKNGMGHGLALYDKIKGYYDSVKSKFANLPIVGTAAAQLISSGETYLSDLIQKKTGFDPRLIMKGAESARKVYDYLPSKEKKKIVENEKEKEPVITLPPARD